MIVIATHNGGEYLPRLLESLHLHGTGGHPTVIVDTGSTDEEFIRYLETVEGTASFPVTVTRTPYRGYDTGAYIWAFKNFKAPSYMCMHDSLRIKCEGWLAPFEDRAKPGIGIVAWQQFGPRYDNDKQIAFVEKHLGSHEMSNGGIFGPIFYITQDVVDIFDERGYLAAIPTDKNEQMGMERGWSAACHGAGLECISVHPYNRQAMYQDEFPDMQKFFPRRN